MEGHIIYIVHTSVTFIVFICQVERISDAFNTFYKVRIFQLVKYNIIWMRHYRIKGVTGWTFKVVVNFSPWGLFHPNKLCRLWWDVAFIVYTVCLSTSFCVTNIQKGGVTVVWISHLPCKPGVAGLILCFTCPSSDFKLWPCLHLTSAVGGMLNTNITKYSLLSIPRISRDWAKYVELSVVRGNQIMTYTYHFGAK